MKNLKLPEIQNLELKHFSLYKKKKNIEVGIDDGVFCLAGANGLGKSTFVNILNYGLTGIVRKPDANFTQYNSIPKFFNDSKSFASEYFDKRIDENHRDLAYVEISFKAGESLYKIKRPFFEIDQLIDLEIKRGEDFIKIPENSSNKDLENLYRNNLTEDIGLSDFDQFVFIQSYVLTFDESHQLLFWDSALMERVLYLFFNLDPEVAKQADHLRKEITTHESNMRNLQWDATTTKKKIDDTIQQLDKKSGKVDSDQESILEKHQSLVEELSNKRDDFKKIESEIDECDLNIADFSSKISHQRRDYEKLFSSVFDEDIAIEEDKNIQEYIRNLASRVCGKESTDDIVENIKTYITKNHCNKVKSPKGKGVKKLKEVDEKIFELKNKLSRYEKRKERLEIDFKNVKEQIDTLREQVAEIENQNEEIIYSTSNDASKRALKEILTGYRKQIEDALNEKEDETSKRDSKKAALNDLEKQLSSQYLEAEEKFLPIFIKYSRDFLGLDVNIDMKNYSKGTSLVLSVDDTTRKSKHQLSESQRYFIDIALRLSLIEYGSNTGSIVIDTPEGSLDIAYESKAGQMFSDFVKKGFNIIMTANINSSQLLLQLAKRCKGDKMKLERMTEWTHLSDVQEQEQGLIDEAYNDIQKELG